MLALLAASLVAVAALTAALAALPTDGAAGAGQRPAPKPNVVVIMTDDQALETIKVMDRTRRALGDHGVDFRNAFVSWPLCCPSRATYLTGQYAHNHGVMGNLPPEGGYSAFGGQEETLPVWLQQVGYRTIHIGKYLNGYGRDTEAVVPPGWSEWYGGVDPSTYRMWGYTLNENGELKNYGEFDDENPALYQTDVLRDKAVEAIRRSAPSRRPFYLNLALLAPHFEGKPRGDELPPRPAPRHAGEFADEPLPRPPSFNEADVGDKPAYHGAVYPPLTAAQIEAITERYRGELESLLAVDEAVGAVVSALRKAGELDNTYILFTSDNGYFHGEHRIPKTKYWLYEPAARVPLLMRGPGIAAGEVSEELVTNVDLAATLTQIAGAEASRPPDGRSLLPFARKPRRRSTRPLLFDAFKPTVPLVDTDGEGGDPTPDAPSGVGGSDGTSQRAAPSYVAIRTSRYLYAEYSTGDRELYDMRLDPHQLRSRHLSPRYAGVMRRLAGELEELRDCAGADCAREIDPIPDPSGR